LKLLVELGVPALKISSGDLTNLVLLRAAAATNLPLLLSTGMATLAEVDLTLADLRAHGDPQVVLLQCTSAYPAQPEDANLLAMDQMRQRYGVPIGYSDHTLGIGAAAGAAALGAAVIEKHLTLDRSLAGPDHHASLEPDEFRTMVDAVRQAASARGSAEKAPMGAEEEIRGVARRSLALTRPLVAGEVIALDDLDALRPEAGISPQRLDEVAGRRAARDLDARVPLQPDDLDPRLE
jgi:N-acetylneuraminate synthase/N,N'-diacetyllegionaminate synthase